MAWQESRPSREATTTAVPLDLYRRFYADEIATLANLRTPALADALATIPRERFLPPGPWLIKTEADFGAPARPTPDADPRHGYHNVTVALDPARAAVQWPTQPDREADRRARPAAGRPRRPHRHRHPRLHRAIAHAVGSSGHVTGIEVDDALARHGRVRRDLLGGRDSRPGDRYADRRGAPAQSVPGVVHLAARRARTGAVVLAARGAVVPEAGSDLPPSRV
jgi:hypothetical protein